MSQRELTFIQWGFAFWFVDLNFQGVDILPDFLGIAFLMYALFSMSKREKAPAPLFALLGLLGIDFLVHWFFVFELPFEILIVRIVSACAIFGYLGTVAARCGETSPGPARGVRICRIAYMVLLALDYVSLVLEMGMLMLVEVAAAWIITLVLFVVLIKVKPVVSGDDR